LKPVYALLPFGFVKLVLWRSAALANSRDRCSNTYLPLVVVSAMAVVFVVLTTPLTRKATTATIRMQATPSATTISSRVNPGLGCPTGIGSLRRAGFFGREIIE
jgi:hypothetical protein